MGPKHSRCIVLSGILDNQNVTILVDSGASGTYVHKRIANKLATFRKNKAIPYDLSGITRDSCAKVNQELRTITLEVDGHSEQLSLDIVDMKYDVVLGMSWLKVHNPEIDWSRNRLLFSRCNHRSDSSGKATPFTKAIWLRPAGRTLATTEPAQCPAEYKEFQELFEEKFGVDALPKHKPWDHQINIQEGKHPHVGPLYSLSGKEEEALREYLKKHLAKGYIRAAPYDLDKARAGYPILFVPKKDGSLRLCVDYRKLNDITIKDVYPLPRIDELQDRLQGAKFFTAIDVRDAYYRVRMKEGHEWKTAFRTRYGLYEYCVMPFGLTNAPATFQKLINDALLGYLDIFCVAYLDDVLIFSKTYEEHVKHVKRVLQALKDHSLSVKIEKCEFHKTEVKFLGHIISREGIRMDPEKIEAVLDWPEPQSIKDVQAFLGLANFNRRFIKNYSRIAAPLTDLTKKSDTAFAMTQKARDAFELLKKTFTTAPLLTIFNPELQTILETDASDGAIAAAITQVCDDGKIRPVAYYSRKMTGLELNYNVHNKELLAIVEAFRYWRVYLEGLKHTVKVYSDYKNLLYWNTTKQLNRRQVR